MTEDEPDSEPTTNDLDREAVANIVEDELSDVVERAGVARSLGESFGGLEDRDYYETFGYPSTSDLDAKDFFAIYRRGGIAETIVDYVSGQTWASTPSVTDHDGEDETEVTEFETAVDDVFQKTKAHSNLERLDTLQRIGRFGVLYIGFDDGFDQMSDRVDPTNLTGDPGEDILHYQPFGELNIESIDRVDDRNDERLGLPESYDLDFGEGIGVETVHHTRVVHAAEGALEDEVIGHSAFRPVFNHLIDLLYKTIGASAEMFYRGADRKLIANDTGDAQGPALDEDKVSKQVQELVHNLRNVAYLRDVELDSIGGDTPDPSGLADQILNQISGNVRIPKRVLLGTERGDLASTQDKAEVVSMIEERRTKFAEPDIYRDFVDLLREHGVIDPEPEGGTYSVEWESIFELTELEKAQLMQRKASAYKQVAAMGDPSEVASLAERREEVLDLPPDRGGAVDDPAAAADPMIDDPDDVIGDVDETDDVEDYFDDIDDISDVTDVEAIADGSGNADDDADGDSSPFSDVPVLPDDLGKAGSTVSKAWLIRWAEWLEVGRPEIPDEARQTADPVDVIEREAAANDFNPAIHPRDPETGQFVERPYDYPSDLPNFTEQSTKEILESIDENGGDLEGTVFDPSENITVDGVPNDATAIDDIDDVDDELTGPPAEVREQFDKIEFGDRLEADDVEEGDIIAAEWAGRRRQHEVTKVDDDPRGPSEAIIRTEELESDTKKSFRLYEDDADRDSAEIYETSPVENPPVEFDDWEDGSVVDRRKEAESLIEKFVVLGEYDAGFQGGNPLPEDEDRREEWVDTNIEATAEGFAATKDRQVAEKSVATLAQIGDGDGGSYAGKSSVVDKIRGYIKLGGRNENTAIHESAHHIMNAHGLNGASGSSGFDYQGKIPERDDLEDALGEWGITEAYSGYSTDIDDVAGVDEFKDRVESEVGPGLDGRNFAKPPETDELVTGDWGAWAEDADVGSMIRFEEYPLQEFSEAGPRNYRITETKPGSDVDVVAATRGFTLEGPNGETFDIGITKAGAIKSANRQETNGFIPEAQGKRESTPDNWGIDNPDPDDALSESPAGSPQERLNRFARRANEAFYKQNVAHDRHGEGVSEGTEIRSSYSAVSAHETIARLHDTMQGNPTEKEAKITAKALVRHHPGLLAAYRDAFDIPSIRKTEINNELEAVGAETRL